DAVLVLGASGETGQAVVKALLEQGRNVVASTRAEEKPQELFDTTLPGLFLQVT
ncbi:unnamed protein product, partial [Discosporangium mesarthrocarpum]